MYLSTSHWPLSVTSEVGAERRDITANPIDERSLGHARSTCWRIAASSASAPSRYASTSASHSHLESTRTSMSTAASEASTSPNWVTTRCPKVCSTKRSIDSTDNPGSVLWSAGESSRVYEGAASARAAAKTASDGEALPSAVELGFELGIELGFESEAPPVSSKSLVLLHRCVALRSAALAPVPARTPSIQLVPH